MQSQRADFAMAGMTPTPERKLNVDFTDIYYDAKNTIVAKKGSNLKKSEDLAGKKVGVQLGTIQEKEAKKIKGANIIPLNKTAEVIQEIKANRINAAIMEDTIAKGFAANNPDLEFNIIPSTEQSGSAIAFPKGSKLVGDFNRVLGEMKTSGEIENLVKKWFGNNGQPAAASTNAQAGSVTTNGKTGNNSASEFSFTKIVPSIPYIIEGILTTLKFTALSAFFGFIWGTILSLFKISTSKPLL